MPVVIATSVVPAYARSSNPEYAGVSAGQTGTVKSYTDTTNHTRYHTDVHSAGYQIQAINGSAATTAKLTSLEYYIVISSVLAVAAPTSLGTTGTYWNAPVKVTTAIPMADGTTMVIPTGYVDYKVTMKTPGATTITIPKGGNSPIVTNSAVNLRFDSQYGNIRPWYEGFVATYATANSKQYTSQSTVKSYQPPAIAKE